MINISKDLLRMKPSKKALAREIDRLNAAISKQHVFQERAEESMHLSEMTAKGWENIASQYKKLVEKYDVEALAEARRLAVLQHSDSNTGKSYEELVQWLSTGQWPDTSVKEMGEVKEEGEYIGSGTISGYAHGYVKGWNTLLDTIQRRWASTLDEVPADRFEHLRKTFNRAEAM